MKASKQQIVTALHDLAHWIDRNDFPGESIVMLSVDGWGNTRAHLSPEAFAARGGVFREDGHGVSFAVDGVAVTTCLPRREPAEVAA